MSTWFRLFVALALTLTVPTPVQADAADSGDRASADGGGGVGGGSIDLPASNFPDDAPTLWAMIGFTETKTSRADRPAIEKHFRIVQKQAKTDADREKLARVKRILTKETRKLYNWFLDRIRETPERFQGNAGVHLALFDEYTGPYLAEKAGDQEEELSIRDHKEHFLNFLLDTADRYPFPTAAMVREIRRGQGGAEIAEVKAGLERVEASEKDTAQQLRGGRFKKIAGVCAVLLAVGAVGWKAWHLIDRGDQRLKATDDQGLIGNGSVPEAAPVKTVGEDPLFLQGQKDLLTKPPKFEDDGP